MLTRPAASVAALGLMLTAALAQAAPDVTAPAPQADVMGDGPRSAIDWLTDPASLMRLIIEPEAEREQSREPIQTTLLGGPTLGGVGLLSPLITGLPQDTFSNARPERLLTLVSDLRPSDLPALQDLALVLLLAELTPPTTADGGTALLRTRVERLIAFGAIDQAQALLELAGADTPKLFDLWFDVSLLSGDDAQACATLRKAPDLTRDLGARVFCLSRGDDWAAGSLTLEAGRALGAISTADALLLSQFLDPEAYEGTPLPPLPATMTPLRFRLLDGLGEPPATLALPLAYAVSDLRDTIGWKAQIEAAERLVRTQAIAPERLRALYTARKPAASGGVWDRATAFQAFDTALQSGDPGAIANALPEVWAAMSRAGLQVPFARMFGADLTDLPLAPAAAQLAFKIGLLSKDFEKVAVSAERSDLPRDVFARSIAMGVAGDPRGLGPLAEAITLGFSLSQVPEPFATLVADDRLGEALLRVLLLLQDGAQSDPGDIAAALVLLRTNGLEPVARQAALQLLLMERPI